ncbi:hypothetical protein [Azohydromonas caseinilytica]|uniref:Uncharacterized protein n=1 Tax=Azohydromonas caseinilytica TaxID=2728836 RepID=A0A848FAX4_9BURK|nr:hypothetical protein [Azohydromonas caseinilytica]NML15589.1 hypothetical protein [Azohydromonas caseinilytica]
MEESALLEFLNQGWVGIVAGLLISVIFHFLARKTPTLAYEVTSSPVLKVVAHTGIQENIAVTYRGESVSQLSVATVTLWNAGRATLEGTSLVGRDLLRVVLKSEQSQILECSIEANPKPACGCEVSLDENGKRALVTFDYLDPADGFSFRILHTGNAGEAILRGVLKGAPIIDADQRGGLLERIKRRLPYTAGGYILFALSIAAFYQWWESTPPIEAPNAFSGFIAKWYLAVISLSLFLGFLFIDTMGDIFGGRVPARLLTKERLQRERWNRKT